MSSLSSSFGFRWSIITFSVSLTSDVSELSCFCLVVILWLLFVLYDASLYTAFHGFGHGINFHDFNFSFFIIVWCVVFPRCVCFYGALLSAHNFSFSDKVFLGR